jgi:hypothetical protein
MAGNGFHSVVANRAQICTADCHEENYLSADYPEENIRTADCHKETVPRMATDISLNLRATCQG